MGLDMYLNAKKYLGYPLDADKDMAEAINKAIAVQCPGKVAYIAVEVMYWRKANAIHSWFVKNCQEGVDECQETDISVDQLKMLLKAVTEVSENHEKAPHVLPTARGFFFGDTSYNEWYFQDIEDTKLALERIIKQCDSGWEFKYRSSW
jgi:hypothetical protein